MRFKMLWLLGLGLPLLAAACAPKEEVYPWTEMPLASPGWAGIPGPAAGEYGGADHRPISLTSGSTDGLFPASIVIARLVHSGVTEDDTGIVQLAKQPTKEFVDWMELFDDYWQIADVMPLAYPGSRLHTGRASDFVIRAGDIGGDLCLIYTIDLNNPQCEIRGSLYSAFDGRLLATITSESEVNLPLDEEDYPPSPDGRIETDWRHIDPYFIALESFRENFRRCIRSLIEQDKPTGRPTASLPADVERESSPALTADR